MKNKADLNQLVHYFEIIESIKSFDSIDYSVCEDFKEHEKTINKMREICIKQLGEAVYTLLNDFDKEEFRFYTKRLLKLYQEHKHGVLRPDSSEERNPD